jgi:Xaa-Pro aminopeptidase
MSALAERPNLDLEERDRRWNRVRDGMAERGIDLLLVSPESNPIDVLYLSGGEQGAVLFPAEGEPWILLGGEDSNLAIEREGWISKRESATPFGSTKVPYGAAVADKLRRLGATPRRVAIAGLDGNLYSHVRSADGYAIYSTVRRILDGLDGVEVVDGAPVMARARYVKSEKEIDAYRDGVAVAEAGARAIGEAFHIGKPQADAYRAGIDAMLQPGMGVPSIAWCPGPWKTPRPRIVGTPPGDVEEGLCVAAEIMPGSRAMTQVAEPFFAGRILPEQQEAFDLNVAAFEATRNALRPGNTWREVEAAALAIADGTEWQVSFLMHGGFDGPLFIPVDSHDDVLDDRVEADTVFIVKPTVFPRDAERVVARSHDVSWGDMVVVKEGGALRLGTRPQRLISYR